MARVAECSSSASEIDMATLLEKSASLLCRRSRYRPHGVDKFTALNGVVKER